MSLGKTKRRSHAYKNNKLLSKPAKRKQEDVELEELQLAIDELVQFGSINFVFYYSTQMLM